MERDHRAVIHEITPLSETDCFYIADRCKTAFTYPIHSHSEYELNFTMNASGVRRIVGDSIEPTGNFDLVLITGRDLEHVWEQHGCTSTNIREITIQFSPDLFGEAFLHKNQFTSIRHMFETAQRGLAFPDETIMRVFRLLDGLSSEPQRFYAVLRFLEILYLLSMDMDKARVLSSSSFAETSSRTDARHIDRIQKYVTTHYRETIRLEELAEMANMSVVQFNRSFKLHSGKSPIDYVIEMRLGYAARQLVDSSKTVSEICFECGFNNVSNFNRLFRKSKNCSPKEFRDNYKKRAVIV